MSAYRKLIAAFIGLAVLFVSRRFAVDLGGTEELLTEAVVSLLTLFGVYQATNDQPEDRA